MPLFAALRDEGRSKAFWETQEHKILEQEEGSLTEQLVKLKVKLKNTTQIKLLLEYIY